MVNNDVRRLVEVVAAGAVTALAAFVAWGGTPTNQEWTAVAFFAAFGAVASGLAYQTSKSTSGSIGFLPSLSAAVISPNVASLLAVLASVLISELVLRRVALKAIFNVSQQVVSVAAAISIYLVLGGESVLHGAPELLPFVGLGLAYFSLNKLAVATVVSLSSGGRTKEIWRQSVQGSLVYDLLAFPLILFFAVAFARLGPWLSTILALPMLGIRQLYRSVFELRKVNEELLQLMVASIEARDPYTSGHSQRVARYAAVIGRIAGLSEKANERAATAALLHDVGKIHEEFAKILRKPGRLTDDEFELMKTHPARSAELVSRVSQFADLVAPVRAHHEAWNGTGYPDRLSGHAIPLHARIIALADTVDAMTSSRPYRSALSLDKVRNEIAAESGSQFDPGLCDRLLREESWTILSQEIIEANVTHPAVSIAPIIEGHTAEFSMPTSRERADANDRQPVSP